MPNYEYLCAKCDRTFAVIKPMAEASDPAQCKQCGSWFTTKVVPVIAFLVRERVLTESAPVPVPVPAAANDDGWPAGYSGISNLTLDCSNAPGATGVKVGNGARVMTHNARIKGAGTGIDVEPGGRLHTRNTDVE